MAMSARFPTSIEPIIFSRCSARAPRIVAISKACSAGSVFGSPEISLCSFAAVSISSHMLRSLFEAAPSVPRPTAMSFSQHRRNRRVPDASFIFDCGQCADADAVLFQKIDLVVVCLNNVSGDRRGR